MKKTVSVKALIIIIAVVFVAAVGAAFLLFQALGQKTDIPKGELIDLRYGDEFSGFEFYDENDNRLTALPKSDKPSLVFYISSGCGGCKKVMDSYDSIQNVLGDSFNFYCMWLSDIPSFAEEKYNIQNSFALKNEYMFATSTPTVFLVNPDNTVEFVANEPETMIDKLFESYNLDKEALKNKAVEYILNKYSKDKENEKQIIYFCMQGCPDCEAADKVINGSDKIKEYEITRVYHRNAKNETLTIDSYKLFQNVFDVKWYPSFFVINGDDERFVGEVPMDVLEDRLIK